MKILKKDIELMAEWSKLWVDEGQKELLVGEFNETLEVLSIIDKLKTDNMEPYNLDGIPIDVFREDRVESSLERELIIKNAPHSYEGMFVVPKTVEQVD